MTILDARDIILKPHGVAKHPASSFIGIAIHHTVTNMTASTTIAAERAHIRAIDTAHARRFGGEYSIGYHVLVFPSGRAYQVGDYDGQRAHVKARNHQLIGIAAVGNFTDALPEQAQWDGIVGAVKGLLVVYPGREIKGHNDWARPGEGTACAGMLNDVKWDDVLLAPTPSAPLAWEPTDREFAHAFAYFYKAIFEGKDPTKLHRNHRYALWQMAESTGPKPEL